jgi:hypothetical protein
MWTAAAAVALLLGAGSAAADSETFNDLLRPNGVARSQAQKLADGRACGLAADNTFTNAPAFEACMRTRGWAPDHPAGSRNDKTNAGAPDRTADANAARSTWIDPDNGLECHSVGIGSVCVPPHGTVTYTNRHGYPCRRTGLVAVCTNLPMPH